MTHTRIIKSGHMTCGAWRGGCGGRRVPPCSSRWSRRRIPFPALSRQTDVRPHHTHERPESDREPLVKCTFATSLRGGDGSVRPVCQHSSLAAPVLSVPPRRKPDAGEGRMFPCVRAPLRACGRLVDTCAIWLSWSSLIIKRTA